MERQDARGTDHVAEAGPSDRARAEESFRRKGPLQLVRRRWKSAGHLAGRDQPPESADALGRRERSECGSLLFLDALNIVHDRHDASFDFRFTERRELLPLALKSRSPEGHIEARMRRNSRTAIDRLIDLLCRKHFPISF